VVPDCVDVVPDHVNVVPDCVDVVPDHVNVVQEPYVLPKKDSRRVRRFVPLTG